MKHDNSRRRHNRRHAAPPVSGQPAAQLPYTPPRNDASLDDAEQLARKNIFETEPRMSRQARRKAARAEKKAARRAATERFLAGAPSLTEAASQYPVAEPAITMAATKPRLMEAVAAALADMPGDGDVLEADATAMTDALTPAALEKAIGEACEATDDPIPLEEIAQIISATGPLIIGSFDDDEGQIAEIFAVADDLPDDEGEDLAALLSGMANELSREAAETADLADSKPFPAEARIEEAAPALMPTAQDAEPDPPTGIVIESMTAPLPRDRALVAHRRSWLMRLIPRRRSPRAIRETELPDAAMAQLQELRFELATALHRLDKLMDGAR